MGRNRDNAPIGHTCPMIDNLIDSIDNLYRSSEEMSKGEMDSMLATLEKIRAANSTLREWGNEEYLKAVEFEKEVDYLNDTVKDLKYEIDDLKELLKIAEREIEKLYERV